MKNKKLSIPGIFIALLMLWGAALSLKDSFACSLAPKSVDDRDIWIWYLAVLANGLLLSFFAAQRRVRRG